MQVRTYPLAQDLGLRAAISYHHIEYNSGRPSAGNVYDPEMSGSVPMYASFARGNLLSDCRSDRSSPTWHDRNTRHETNFLKRTDERAVTGHNPCNG